MKKTVFLLSSMLVVMTFLSIVSCSKDLYDKDQYEQYLDYNSPVDSIDSRHQWVLTKMQQYRITAPTGMNVEVAMILAENPLTESTAHVLNQAKISDGGSVTLPVTIPMTQTYLYAALVDKEGKYYVVRFPVSQTTIEFKTYSYGTPSSLTLKPQAFTYIFEENFPLAGDYDYNDLVIRIGVEKVPDNPRMLTLEATLIAVGCQHQLAGMVRLLNCKYDDIDSIKTANGKTFNDDLPAASTELYNNRDLFIRGRNNEAIINMFIDAHWVMNTSQDVLENSGALAIRKYYNTSLSNTDEYESRPYQTQRYNVYFKSEEKVRNFTTEQLDPFILAIYNGARYETHRYELQAAQVLFPYQVEYRIKDLPWSFTIPVEKFCHPLEGVQIGFRKRTQTGTPAMFGAYTVRGHSFGEWVENCETNLDWYNNPANKNDVWIF